MRFITMRRDVVAMDVSIDSNGDAWEAPVLSDYIRIVILGIPLPANWGVRLYRRVIERRRHRVRGVTL